MALLDAALNIAGAPKGNVQVLDPSTGALKIAVHRGFAEPFLDFFREVGADHVAACASAMQAGERVVVRDVLESAIFAGQPSRQVLLDAGVRAVQSTPLVASDGRVLGMMSTHFEHPHAPDEWVLRMLDILARQAADYLQRVHADQTLRQNERELREADRRKDEFLATLAHELRNPLAPVRTGLHLRREAGSDPHVKQRVMDTLDRQVTHMVRLVDDLLEVSRVSRSKIDLRKELVDLASLVRTAIETVGPTVAARGQRLEVHLPSQPVWLEVDPVRLAQVIGNLLNNATKYTDPGGLISIHGIVDGRQVSVSVRDTGVGIPSEMLPCVFDLFTQIDRTLGRAQGGLGIGLALVKHLMEMHGGSVEARSDGPGRGSEFVVRLSTAAAPRAASAPDDYPSTLSAVAAGLRCLVVDDYPDSADTLAMLLATTGADVRTTYDGTSALAEIRAWRPSVVFLDLGMPGLDGYEVARQTRADSRLREITLVAVTGWGQQEDRRRTHESGFDAHLVKPVAIDALIGYLQSLQVRSESRR
jgi:signal transduction histidine kinase/CheY-like chemotaxis protein